MAKSKTAPKPILSQEALNMLLLYDGETGSLFWKERPIEFFSDGGHGAEHNQAKWNAKFAGKEAFTADNGVGYRSSSIRGQMLLAHRVIWKMRTGEEPVQVDHIDGVRSNNRWGNLRSVTALTNRHNMTISKKNSSGVTGVRRVTRSRKWQAFITVNYKMRCLGSFETIEDAVAARKAAEHLHSFHPNHGRSPN